VLRQCGDLRGTIGIAARDIDRANGAEECEPDAVVVPRWPGWARASELVAPEEWDEGGPRMHSTPGSGSDLRGGTPEIAA
jgi:hypothetical protein